MRILVVRPYADFAVADVANGLVNALKARGHEIEEYALSKRLRVISLGLRGLTGRDPDGPQMALLASEPIAHKAIASECEWVFIVCGGWVHPDALVTYKAIGGKVACVFTEGPYESGEDGELRLLQVCDVAFTNEASCVPMFEKYLRDKGNTHTVVQYLPHSYDPTVHNTQAPEVPLDTDDKCDVLLVGTGFTERLRLLEQINWDGIDFALGGLWLGIDSYGDLHKLKKHIRWPCIDNKDLARLYHGCKIVLNIHRWANDAESLGPRVYEVAACGAFQICDDSRRELGNKFEDSIPTYSYGVPWRLEACIRKWLADDVGRAEKAAKANKLVQPYSFANRASQIEAAMLAFDGSRATATSTSTTKIA